MAGEAVCRDLNFQVLGDCSGTFVLLLFFYCGKLHIT